MFIGMLFFYMLLSIGIWYLAVLYLRWLFRINVMVKTQEAILRELQSLDMPRKSPPPPKMAVEPSPVATTKPSPVVVDNVYRSCTRCKNIILPNEKSCVHNGQLVCYVCDTVLRSPGGID